MSAALVSAPMAFGAGDPVASGTFKLKLSGGFKNQLKHNGVKMKPKKSFKVQGGSNLDPTTGAGLIRLGKITFKKGGKKYVYKNLKATLGANGGKGNISGSNGKIFKLKGGTLARNGFGATLTGIKLKFLKGAAKKINKALELNSLHPGKAGSASADEQPKTVAVTGGFAFVDIPLSFLPPPFGTAGNNTVAAKQPAHCLSPLAGVKAIEPGALATLTAPNPDVGPLPSGGGARFKFPVTGGTVGPTGTAGAPQLAGGVRLSTGAPIAGPPPSDGVFTQDADCDGETVGLTTSDSILEITNLAPNLALGNVQSNVNFAGVKPGCNGATETATCPTAVFAGSKGVAIGQLIDLSGAVVAADPAAKTLSISGALISNNALSATVLSGLFPDYSGATPWADGDKFGFSTLNVTTR